MSSKRPKKAYPAKASGPRSGAAWPSRIRRRRSGSRSAAIRSARGRPAILGVGPGRGEHVGRGLQAEQHPDRPGGHLGLDVESLGLQRGGQGHQVAPPLGCLDVLLHGVADRAPAGPGEGGDQLELGPGEVVVGGPVAVRQELEDARCPARQDRGQGQSSGSRARSVPRFSPVLVRWRSVRDVETPRAPASRPSPSSWPSAPARRHRDARPGRRPARP